MSFEKRVQVIVTMEKDSKLTANAKKCSKQRAKGTYRRKRISWQKKKKKEAEKAAAANTTTTNNNNDEGIVTVQFNSVEVRSVITPVNKVVDVISNIADDGGIDGFVLMDLAILDSLVNCLCCPECSASGHMSLKDIPTKKQGLSRYLAVVCSCGYSRHFYSSQKVDNKNISSGNKPFEINIRAVYGMRSIGGGHAALEKFCGFLNMPAPMTKNNYDKVSKNLKEAAKTVAENLEVVVIRRSTLVLQLATQRIFLVKWRDHCHIYRQRKDC